MTTRFRKLHITSRLISAYLLQCSQIPINTLFCQFISLFANTEKYEAINKLRNYRIIYANFIHEYGVNFHELYTGARIYYVRHLVETIVVRFEVGQCHFWRIKSMFKADCTGKWVWQPPWAQICLFVWFDSLRPINNLSFIKGRVFLGWTSTKLGLMCLAQRHNAVAPVRLELAALRSRVKHSTTEPLRSLRAQ